LTISSPLAIAEGLFLLKKKDITKECGIILKEMNK